MQVGEIRFPQVITSYAVWMILRMYDVKGLGFGTNF